MDEGNGERKLRILRRRSKVQKTTNISCELCNKTYRTKFELKNHIAVSHTHEYRYHCEVCMKGFYLESVKRRHLQRSHKKRLAETGKEKQKVRKKTRAQRVKKIFSCHLCDKKYPSSLALKNHIVVIHTHEYRFRCDVCNKGFYLECQKRRHLEIHKEKKEVQEVKNNFPCSSCDKTYSSNLHLKNHIVLAHTHEYRYYCEFCNRGFFFESQKRTHLLSHKDKEFQCELCGKNFTLESSLKMHIKNIHEGKRYPCEICGKVILGRSSYYSHKQHKHNENNPSQKKMYVFRYSCEKCGRRFMYPSEVTKHLKLTRCGGNEDSIFRCTVNGCPKICKSISSLRYHQSTHQAKKPTCSICFKEFAHPSGLEAHKKIHDKERQMFLCHFCDTRVTTAISLKYHLRTHTREKLFRCNICGKEFNTNTHLTQHRLVHDDVKRHVCRVCQKAFRYRGNLKAHFRKIHPSEVF